MNAKVSFMWVAGRHRAFKVTSLRDEGKDHIKEINKVEPGEALCKEDYILHREIWAAT